MTTDLLTLGNSFARDLRAEGTAPRTITLYGQSIRFFTAWLIDQGKTSSLDELTRDNIREWLAGLVETKATETVRTRYRGLYRFCGWLAAEEEIASNPMIGMKPPPSTIKPVPVLTDDELAAIVKACTGKDFAHRRDEVIVRMLIDCGVRVSELAGMTVEGVHLDAGYTVVIGKGSKVRPVYFGARTTRALDRYLRQRSGHRWAHLDALLLSQRGAMTPDGIRERLAILGQAAGIDGLHPHRFRHTYAHDFLMSGGQERDLKRLAGWSSDVMLERYGASAADSRARAAAERLRRGDRI